MHNNAYMLLSITHVREDFFINIRQLSQYRDIRRERCSDSLRALLHVSLSPKSVCAYTTVHFKIHDMNTQL